jgi:hypothetical protein
MKEISKAFIDFILDFGLDENDDIICFDAVIYFTSNNKSIQLSTEVQITTIGYRNLTVLYLLNPEVAMVGIPDIYHDGNEEFRYFKNLALFIKGKSLIHGKYTLSIHPGNNKCDECTLAEIHAKMNN